MTVKGENINLCNPFPLCWGLKEASSRINGLQVEQIWKRWRQNVYHWICIPVILYNKDIVSKCIYALKRTNSKQKKQWKASKHSGNKMPVRICKVFIDTFVRYCFDLANDNKLFLTNAFPESCHRLPKKVEQTSLKSPSETRESFRKDRPLILLCFHYLTLIRTSAVWCSHILI